MNYDLLLGDCLEIPLPDASVDLVFTSPPYESARSYGIDFNLKGQDYVDWAVARFMEHLRVCKGLVAWVIEGQTRDFRWSATPALLIADLHRRGVHLRKPPVYHRVGIPGSGGPDWLRNDYEFVVCASSRSGRLPWSENTAMGHPPKWAPGGEMSYRLSDGARRNQWGAGPKSGRERKRNGSREPIRERASHQYTTTKEQAPGYKAPVKANPGNVIHCKVGGGLMGSPLAHENEAPFPEKMAEFFVRSFCPPDGTALDPFCGSGTTLAAAIKSGRRAVGMDIRQSQLDLTARRLNGAQLEFVASTPSSAGAGGEG